MGIVQAWGSKPLGEIVLGWLRSLWRIPSVPDPWPEDVDRAIREPGAVEVCHHCLEPQVHRTWFCPHCGAGVGECNNFMPFLYIFSIGEVLRSGTGPEARFTRVTVPGYVIVGLSQFGVFAPVYFFRLFMNWRRRSKSESAPALDGLGEAGGNGASP